MKLKKIEDSLYLCAWPISEMSTLYANVKEYSYIEVSKEKPFMEVLDISALDIYINGVYNEAAVLNINLFGIPIICDMRNNNIAFGNAKGPLSIKKDKFQLRIIVDKNSIEIFIDEGEFLLSGEVNCDYILNYMKIISNIPVSVEKIKIASLKNQYKVRI
jgi:sucrose-6-phosphate hydrolase SacC (GH32 family)